MYDQYALKYSTWYKPDVIFGVLGLYIGYPRKLQYHYVACTSACSTILMIALLINTHLISSILCLLPVLYSSALIH